MDKGEERGGVEGKRGGERFGVRGVQGVEGVEGVVEENRVRDEAHVMALLSRERRFTAGGIGRGGGDREWGGG